MDLSLEPSPQRKIASIILVIVISLASLFAVAASFGRGMPMPGLIPSVELYFASNRDGKVEIYQILANGTIQRLTTTDYERESGNPSRYLSDGLLFSSNRTGNMQIYHLHANGQLEKLTSGSVDSMQPAASPDGSVFYTVYTAGKGEIFHRNQDGTIDQFTNTQTGAKGSYMSAPAPDGSVFFCSDRDSSEQIYRILLSGQTVAITHPGMGNNGNPAVAPDGSLFFDSDRSGRLEIYHLQLDGQTVQVTNTPNNGLSYGTVIAKDGTLYFSSTRSGKMEVYRLSISGDLKQMTTTPGVATSWTR